VLFGVLCGERWGSSKAAELLLAWGGAGCRAILSLLYEGDVTPVIKYMKDGTGQAGAPLDDVVSILTKALSPGESRLVAIRQAQEAMHDWVWNRWGNVT